MRYKKLAVAIFLLASAAEVTIGPSVAEPALSLTQNESTPRLACLHDLPLRIQGQLTSAICGQALLDARHQDLSIRAGFPLSAELAANRIVPFHDLTRGADSDDAIIGNDDTLQIDPPKPPKSKSVCPDAAESLVSALGVNTPELFELLISGPLRCKKQGSPSARPA